MLSPDQMKLPATTRATRLVAESFVDHCSGGAPDGDWGDCCERHDRAFEFGSRWRLDRFLVSNARLGWCVATKPTRTIVGRIGRGLIGLTYGTATSTFGLIWWFAAKPVASQVKQIARDHIEKAERPY